MLLLVLSSAVIHPFRDLLLKRVSHHVSAYLGVCLVWIAIAGIHAVASGTPLLLPWAAVLPAILSAIGLGAYYMGTLLAMRRGELSVYYPIIRSSPAAIVVMSWLVLDKSYPITDLIGIVLIMIGALFLQRTPDRFFGDGHAMAVALIAMLGSALYSIADAEAMRTAMPPAFLFWVYILVSLELAIGAVVVGYKNEPVVHSLFASWNDHGPRLLTAAATSYLSYFLILIAFGLGGDAAEVSATRQFSIPVSILLASIFLKEPRLLQRLVWGFLMLAGILILS